MARSRGMGMQVSPFSIDVDSNHSRGMTVKGLAHISIGLGCLCKNAGRDKYSRVAGILDAPVKHSGAHEMA